MARGWRLNNGGQVDNRPRTAGPGRLAREMLALTGSAASYFTGSRKFSHKRVIIGEHGHYPVLPRAGRDAMAGRRRSPLTGAGLPVELAQRLRDLRDASELTLRQLAAKSGYSSSALSQAESGRGVCSWDVVSTFVQSCGDDPAHWRQLWELAGAVPVPATTAVPSDTTPPSGTTQVAVQATPPPARPMPAQSLPVGGAGDMDPASLARRRWRGPTLTGAVAAVIALTVAIGWQVAAGPPAAAPRAGNVASADSTGRRASVARDNTDPYSDGCRTDERQLDSRPVFRHDGAMFGLITLMYSAACQASWGYLDAPNSSKWTIHIITRRIPGPGTVNWQFSGSVPFGSWGNVLSTRGGCVYTEAYVVDSSGQGPISRTGCIQPTS
jgi:Helix-turn-helix domain